MADLRTTIRREKDKPCRFTGMRLGGINWSPDQRKEAEQSQNANKITDPEAAAVAAAKEARRISFG